MPIVPLPDPADRPDSSAISDLLPDGSVLLTLTDPVERARTANEIVGRLQPFVQFVLLVRREALREAADRGIPRPELARHIGVTASRVGQLLTGSRRSTTRPCPDNTVGAVR